MAAKKTKSASPESTIANNAASNALTPVVELGTLKTVLLSDIDLTYENQRTGDWTQGDSNDSDALESNSFKELVESIRETGQKDPVTVRPKGKKLQLIKGFRRYAALRLLASQNNKLKTATINVIVKNLNDIDAFEEHVIENASRDNLKGSDLAFAAYKLGEHYRSRGTSLSGNAIAARMGKNQSYISMLLRIISGAPKIAAQWREADVQLSITEMARIAKLKDPAAQQTEYDRLLSGKPESGGSGPGGKEWIDTATEKAVKVAAMLGMLARKELVTVNITWDENLPDLGVKLKSDVTAAQRRLIGKAAREAFAAALNEPEATEPAAKGE